MSNSLFIDVLKTRFEESSSHTSRKLIYFRQRTDRRKSRNIVNSSGCGLRDPRLKRAHQKTSSPVHVTNFSSTFSISALGHDESSDIPRSSFMISLKKKSIYDSPPHRYVLYSRSDSEQLRSEENTPKQTLESINWFLPPNYDQLGMLPFSRMRFFISHRSSFDVAVVRMLEIDLSLFL